VATDEVAPVKSLTSAEPSKPRRLSDDADEIQVGVTLPSTTRDGVNIARVDDTTWRPCFAVSASFKDNWDRYSPRALANNEAYLSWADVVSVRPCPEMRGAVASSSTTSRGKK